MRVRKVILIVLLLFAVASLLIIAYSAKNKMGMFGKFYDSYVKEQTALAGITVKSNLEGVFNEVKPLSEDNAIKSIFVASSLGESTDRYVEDITRIRDALVQCRKIQAFDTEGRVIFSTSPEEIDTQKMKSSVVQKLKDYFRMNNGLFVYFADKNEFVSIYPLAQETVHGYIAVYYDNQRLLKGMPRNKMSAPVSFDNYMFLTAKNIEKKDIGKIVDYYSNPETRKTNAASQNNPTVGGLAQFNGLNVIYYAKNDKYIPLWTLLILTLDLFLLGAVIFTLIQMFLENKMYKKVKLSSFDREVEPGSTPSYPSFRESSRDTEIEGLVTDIESNRPYEEKVAEKGIEDMILTSNVNLTDTAETLAMADEDDRIALEPGELMELEQKEKIELPDFNFKIDKPDSFKQKSSADLFAEQERILDGVDNKPFEEESISFETPVGLKAVPEIDVEAPGLEAAETPDLQLSSDLEELESIKPAPETAAAPESDSGEINIEEVVPTIQSEDDGLDYKPSKFAADEDLTITLGEGPDDINLLSRPRADEDIVLSMDTSETPSAKEEILPDITPSDELTPFEDNPAVKVEVIPMAEPVQVFEDTEPIPENESLETEKTKAVVSLSPKEYELKMKKVFVEPPVRLSSICSVEDYGKAAIDIAKKSLNINKVLVLEKKGAEFKTILNKGFESKDFGIDMNDPVYKIFLSQKKSLDISGDLQESRYLKERFNQKDIKGIEEFFIMPIINKEDISGIALFARENGTAVPTNFQRSELFNLGFLQES